jgi:mRNA interferase MazF
MAGGLKRGDIHLVLFSAPDKRRPALLLTRDSIVGSLGSVTVAPITSTIRGVDSEVMLGLEDGMKAPCALNFHNVMTVRKSAIGRRVASLSPERMGQVCAALNYALGCII